MKRRTRSLLDEISSLVPDQDKDNVLESRANHVIASAINLINIIKETYDEDTASDLERRLLNSIKSQDSSKFSRGIKRVKKS